jgi:hypothetical protein
MMKASDIAGPGRRGRRVAVLPYGCLRATDGQGDARPGRVDRFVGRGHRLAGDTAGTSSVPVSAWRYIGKLTFKFTDATRSRLGRVGSSPGAADEIPDGLRPTFDTAAAAPSDSAQPVGNNTSAEALV